MKVPEAEKVVEDLQQGGMLAFRYVSESPSYLRFTSREELIRQRGRGPRHDWPVRLCIEDSQHYNVCICSGVKPSLACQSQSRDRPS